MVLDKKELENTRFLGLWIQDFGFEPTIYSPEDFESVELLGTNKEDGDIFMGLWDNGARVILRGTIG